jgi:hypothetical protein
VTERHGDPRFYALIEEISQLHSDKNFDYASRQNPLANFEECRGFGVEPHVGVFVRMSDKWSRLKQLIGGKSPKNESVRDTLIDLAVYALINVILLEDEERAKARSGYRPVLNVEVVVAEPVGKLGFVVPQEQKMQR